MRKDMNTVRRVHCYSCKEVHATKQALQVAKGFDNRNHLYCSDCREEIENRRPAIALRVEELITSLKEY